MERGEELGELVVDGILVAGLVAGWWMKGWRRGGGVAGAAAWRLRDCMEAGGWRGLGGRMEEG